MSAQSSAHAISPLVDRQRARRRTFAIISHPDAGKTTLTEKLLLFGGTIEIAGMVRGRKTQRSATSDWMELEKQRGISVSSTVLTFEFDQCQVNLLDTPGHHDFSEDTYRTLIAADAAVMVIDLAKGVETQTEKLFHVCALRKIPVFTFVNKVDRPGLAPLEVLDEVERKFSIQVVPQNWPVGSGPEFCGIVDLQSKQFEFFHDRDGQRRTRTSITPWNEIEPGVISENIVDTVNDEMDLVNTAGTTFELSQFLSGQQSPVYFGSALTNFGVENFLRGFLKLCPPPSSRDSNIGIINPSRPDFSGFVFKIQANLDPRHRDRVAFVRVCSGRFERDMEVTVSRSGKKLRLPRALKIFGQDRQTMDEAYPGDIIGLVNPGEFQLGDTICGGEIFEYESLPQFSPEFFAVLDCPDTSRRKQFDRGLSQLVEEGAIQIFHDAQSNRREAIVAAVGELQFDVVRFRIENEYKAPTSISWRPFKMARWVSGPEADLDNLRLPYGAKLVVDQYGHTAVLLQSEWDLKLIIRENKNIHFADIRVQTFEERKATVDAKQPDAD